MKENPILPAAVPVTGGMEGLPGAASGRVSRDWVAR